MLKIAIVGLGQIVEHHIRAIGQIDGIVLVAGCDTNPHARQSLPSGIPFFENHRALLDACDADIFVVATPPATHHTIARDTLIARRGLMIEKPATQSLEELEDLLQLHAAMEGAPFFHFALHAAHSLEVRWWLEHWRTHMALGPVTSFHAFRYDPHIRNGRFVQRTASQVGPWLDSGINALSAVGVFVLPELERMCILSSRMTGHGLVENCTEVAGSASIAFTPLGRAQGLGSIEVDWTLGVNRKGLTLCYAESHMVVHLDDSEQSVRMIYYGREVDAHACEAGNLPRLTHHYVGVYRDLLARFSSGQSNLDHAVVLHRLMFEAWNRSPSVWTPSP